MMGQKDVFGQKMQCHVRCKWSKLSKMALFSHKMTGGPLARRKTTIVRKGFENSFIGPQTRAISADFWTKVGQKRGNGSAKKRGIFLYANFSYVLDAELNIAYDSPIKHGLIQWHNQLMTIRKNGIICQLLLFVLMMKLFWIIVKLNFIK